MHGLSAVISSNYVVRFLYAVFTCYIVHIYMYLIVLSSLAVAKRSLSCLPATKRTRRSADHSLSLSCSAANTHSSIQRELCTYVLGRSRALAVLPLA
jgi:hypothetical protein